MMKVVMARQHTYRFIIYAPEYCEDSSGVRALYRLCHLLNCAGYDAAIYPFGDIEQYSLHPSPWNTPIFAERVVPSGTVVIYPEIIRGNPLRVRRVVRWILNYPGIVGGDPVFAENELVMVWDRKMLSRVNSMCRCELNLTNVLQVPVVDPNVIYPDSGIVKDLDCYFIYKGWADYEMFHQRYCLPDQDKMVCIDHTVNTQCCLGELLRRTKRLYSFDHATILFHEALISRCDILQVHGDGLIVDPRTCSAENRPCSQKETTSWPLSTFPSTYAQEWDDVTVAHRFAELVVGRWSL
jgi:hypothetical protein